MSFPAFPEYKDSGVPWLGPVPTSWELVRFKNLLRERDQRSTDGSEELLSVSAYTGVRPKSESTADGEFASRAESLEGYKVCKQTDLVMNIMLAWNRGLGVTQFDGIVSPAYCVFALGEKLHPAFFDYAVRAEEYTGYFKAYSSGVIDSRLRLYPDKFGALSFAKPPLEEQEAIAAFLNRETAKIDALVAQQERLIELLKEKRQAVISHAITKGLDPDAPMKDSCIEWLGEIPAHWEVRRLRFVADIETGDADTAHAVEEGEYPFFVRSPNIERINRYTHDCEAVMTAGDGAGVGKVFHHFTGKFCAHQRVYIFTNFRGVSGMWFYEYLKALFYRVVLEGTAKSTVDSLRRPMIADFPVTIPAPDEIAAIEAHIAEECRQFDELMAEAEKAVELLKERRAALISAAVTGKIDVRGLVEQHEMEAA